VRRHRRAHGADAEERERRRRAGRKAAARRRRAREAPAGGRRLTGGTLTQEGRVYALLTRERQAWHTGWFPMSKRFELASTFEPKGDQPQAIAELTEGIGRGDRH